MVRGGFLGFQYLIHPRVGITFEGYEKVPPAPVVFAMNHTDYYTFFPFLHRLIGTHKRFAAAWVKGKNYDSRFTAGFMEHMSQLPVPSRGYLIARDFLSTMGRPPTDAEYEALADAADPGDRPRVLRIPHERLRVLPSSTESTSSSRRTVFSDTARTKSFGFLFGSRWLPG